jgi:hypothetical protein
LTLQKCQLPTATHLKTPYTPTLPCHSIRHYTNFPNNPLGDNSFLIQVDSGENCSITNNKDHLVHFQPIQNYPIYGIAKDTQAINCTDKGYIPWQSSAGDTIHVPALYSPDAAEVIIFPTDIVLSHPKLFTGWAQSTHVATTQGNITFFLVEGTKHPIFELDMINGLWYHKNNFPSTHTQAPSCEHTCSGALVGTLQGT